MTEVRNIGIAVAACVLAFFLQVTVAPYLTIAGVFPNLVVAVCLGIAVTDRSLPATLFAFVCGIVYSLLCGGPVGALGALLVFAVFLSDMLMGAFDNDTVFVPIAIALAGCLMVELGMAVLMCASGLMSNMFEAVIYLGFPCAVFDWVASIVVIVALSSVFTESKPRINLETPQFR